MPCPPPEVVTQRPGGPTIPLDHAILRALDDGPMELREISRRVSDTSHHVHARVQTLIAKGLVVRNSIPGGPRRGPGASVYALTET